MNDGLVRTIGTQAARWRTVPPQRNVLVVVHNVTAMTRLLDVLAVFEGDFRVQLSYAWNGSDPFPDGLHRMLAERGIPLVPWNQALLTRFDLAIAANLGGLVELDAPILSVPHGIRYTKVLPRRPETGDRRPETRDGRRAFGLDPQWVLYEGRPIAAALVLSHEQQRIQLAEAVPEAADGAVVAGDACYDRLRASLPWRPVYRRALGADGRTLLVVSSTWWAESVLGRAPQLFAELLAEFPADEFRIAAILHPNIWYGHGGSEVRRMLAPHERSGLVVVPPEFGWRAALIAADYVVGDHGSVTTYGAALGKPTLLAAFPESEVAPGSIVDLVGRAAPRLSTGEPVRPRLDDAARAAEKFGDIKELVTSCPDEAADRLRRLCYEMLRLPEPATEPPVPPDDLTGLPAQPWTWRPTAAYAQAEVLADGSLRVRRYAAEMQRGGDSPADSHLVVSANHPGRRLRGIADVVVLTEDWPDVEQRLAEALAERPGAQIAAAVAGDSCLVRTCTGEAVWISAARPGSCDPACFASAVHGWLAAGNHLGELARKTTVNGVPVTVSDVVTD